MVIDLGSAIVPGSHQLLKRWLARMLSHNETAKTTFIYKPATHGRKAFGDMFSTSHDLQHLLLICKLRREPQIWIAMLMPRTAMRILKLDHHQSSRG